VSRIEQLRGRSSLAEPDLEHGFGCAVDRNELFAYLSEHLSPQKTPHQWFEVGEFPLTGSGKIQKFKLREQWQAGEWSEL
jgi:acyl-CoA synthetase (AMP-forming)/AMP-acid ligase II